MSALRGSRLWVVLGVLLAVVLTAATYLLVIAPARTEAASVRSQADDASLQQIVLRHRLRDLEAAAGHMGDLQAQLAAAQAAVPTAVDTQGLLRRVQAVAAAAGVTIEHVTLKTPTATAVEGVLAVPVDVTLLGSADALVAAVGQLQTGGDVRLVTIGSGTLESAEDGAFRLSMAVSVYTTTAPTTAAAGSGTTSAGAAVPAAPAAGAAAAAGGVAN